MGKSWSKKVRERDGNACVKCGMNTNECVVESHHVVKKLDEEVSDGAAVCKWCHILSPMGFEEFKKWKSDSTSTFELMLQYVEKYNSKVRNPYLESFIEKISPTELQYFLGVLSKFISKHDQKRLNMGKESAKKRGSKIHGVPYGKKIKNGELVNNLEEIRTIRKIHKLNKSKLKYLDIAKILNSDGLKTKNGNSWTAENVRWIIRLSRSEDGKGSPGKNKRADKI